LAGEFHCGWSPWFRAHFTDFQDLRNTDWTQWTADHAELVHAHAEFLQEKGWNVFVEGANAFKLEGQTGIVLAGQPDIVAVSDSEVRIDDCKTGGPRVSDRYQLLIYMALLPYVRPGFKARDLTGHLVYADCTEKALAGTLILRRPLN
jgi:PD-(D/E)XK nuclease superfamily